MAQSMKIFSLLSARSTFNGSRRYLRAVSNGNSDFVRNTKEMVIPLVNQDILLGTLKTSKSIKGVLDVIRSHNSIMNNKHTMQALRTIFILQKQGTSDVSTNQLLKHPDFDRLCRTLKRQAGVIELNETIEALKVMTFVGAKSTSHITQVLLQLLRHQVNQLSLHQIIFLDFLLTQQQAEPLVDALRIALPIVFEIQLPVKLDTSGLQQMVECLHYASTRNVSDKCVEYLVENIMNYQGEMDAKSVISMLWSICEMKPNYYFEPLVTKALDSLLVHVDNLSYGDMENTLHKLIMKCSQKYQFYYSDVFCDVCVNYLIDHDLGLKDAVLMSKKFVKLYHESPKLLDYVSTLVYKGRSVFDSCEPAILYALLNALSMSDYRPVYWENLKELIARTDKFVNYDKSDIFWVKLCGSLFCLDIDKPEVVEMTLKPGYVDHVIKNGRTSDLEYLLLVIQTIHAFKPQYKRMLPGQHYMDGTADKRRLPSQYLLRGSLALELGGERFVLTNVTTEQLHQIDHAIVFDKDGDPVPFSKEFTKLEDIELASGSQVVVILEIDRIHHTINTKKLKASTQLGIRTLEAKGYVVVPIWLQVWNELADFEKIPYMMQAIKEKTDKSQRMTERV